MVIAASASQMPVFECDRLRVGIIPNFQFVGSNRDLRVPNASPGLLLPAAAQGLVELDESDEFVRLGLCES